MHCPIIDCISNIPIVIKSFLVTLSLPQTSMVILWGSILSWLGLRLLMFVLGLLQQPRIPISSTVHIFDLPTGEWSAVKAVNGPTPRVGHTAAACGPVDSEKIYIFGGRNGIALGDGGPLLYTLDSGYKSDPLCLGAFPAECTV